MKFQNLGLISLFVFAAIMILLFVPIFKGIDCTAYVRSQNIEIAKYLIDARKAISDIKFNNPSVNTLSHLNRVDEYLAAAQVVVNDQKKTLD